MAKLTARGPATSTGTVSENHDSARPAAKQDISVPSLGPSLRQLLPIWIILFLSYGLRVFQIGRQGFWFDEAASDVIARRSLLEVVQYSQAHPFEHPPFYYLLLHLWMAVAGESEFGLRFLSLLLGVLFVALMLQIGRLIGDARLFWLLGLIAALAPFQVEQSQETRMYTLLSCLGALSLICFFRGLSKPAWQWWFACVIVAGIGLATHYYFIMLPLGQTVFFLLRRRDYGQEKWHWLLIHLLLLVPGVLWIVFSPGPREALGESVSPWAFARALSDLPHLGLNAVLGDWGFVRPGPVAWAATALIIVLSLAGAFGGWYLLPGTFIPRVPRRHMYLLALIVLMVSLTVPMLMDHSFLARYLSFAMPLFYLLIGLGLLSLRRLGRAYWLLGLVVCLGVSFLGLNGLYSNDNKGQFRDAAREVLAISQPDDAIILTHVHQWTLAEYYFRGGPQVYFVPDGVNQPTDTEIDAAMRPILADHSRVWLGPTGVWTMDREAKGERWLQEHAFQAFKRWLPETPTWSVNAYSYFFIAGPKMTEHPANLRGEQGLSLTSYSLSELPVQAGDAALLRINWDLPNQPSPPLVAGLRLLDSQGRIWTERRGVLKDNADGTLRLDGKLQSNFALYIPPGSPPGRYHLGLSVYLPEQGRNMPFFREGSREGLVEIPLGKVTVGDVSPIAPVEPGRYSLKSYLPLVDSNGRPPGLRPPDLITNMGVTFAGKLKLHGYGKVNSKDTLLQGESLDLELWWQAQSPLAVDYRMRFQFVDEKGNSTLPLNGRPLISELPTGAWRAGEYLRGLYQVAIPNDLTAGRYTLSLSLEDPQGNVLAGSKEQPRPFPLSLFFAPIRIDSESHPLFTLKVNERPRTFAASPDHVLAANLGGKVKVVGYDSPATTVRPGDTFRIDLYWQALANMDTSYTGFVHLVNASGQLVGQKDSLPQKGTHPTNVWLKGEIVRDEFELLVKPDLPDGEYFMVAGLYDARDMLRLPVLDAQGQQTGDAVPVASLQVRR